MKSEEELTGSEITNPIKEVVDALGFQHYFIICFNKDEHFVSWADLDDNDDMLPLGHILAQVGRELGKKIKAAFQGSKKDV